jgi:pilus assembly protein CpaF
MNFAFCGEPGVGKTEGVKSFARYIPENERIVSIEDTLETHLHEIFPYRDIIELLISKGFSYTDAIKHCLRLDPKWVILSEARSVEVKYLLEQWSTGLRGFTTLHLDDLRNLVDRIMNMLGKSKDADRLENNIYEYVSVGVLIRKKQDGTRYIDQVALYDRTNRKNTITMLVEDGRLQEEKIPEKILNNMKLNGIHDPFHCDPSLLQ